jgi:hypothetical protein
MKSLDEFKSKLTEEEKKDFSKFDALVRAGLANKAQITRLHQILDKMGEERPVFNNADRMIMQNLFNKMIDLISNNKQIFQQTRRAVREEVELDEGIKDTSDYKLSPSGRKVKAHRFKVGDDLEMDQEDKRDINEEITKGLPPFALVLKRKAIRQYPNNTMVALYWSDKLKRYFSVPFEEDSGKITGIIQSEEVEPLDEMVLDSLKKIVQSKQASSVKFDSGHTRKIDHFTASAIVNIHGALNDENKKKFATMIQKSPEHFSKASDFAFKQHK